MSEFPETVEVEEPETEAAYTLVAMPVEVTLADLPQSAKKAYKAAAAMGWDVKAWLTVGDYSAVPFLNHSKEGAKKPHNAGDVRYEAFTERMFTVEAQAPSLPLGFQAHYQGRTYPSGRKPVAGSFSRVRLADPVGVPKPLHATYEAITQTRGKYETEASIKVRRDDAQKMADDMDASYNDGATYEAHDVTTSVAGEFDAWLAEWASFTNPKAAR